MTFDVAGLGVSTIDVIFIVDELPGREMVQRAHASTIQGGGPVATAIVAAARLGARTAMLDRIGGDPFGGMILSEFAVERVNTEGIIVAEGRRSSTASILVRREDGARVIAFSPGDCGELEPREVREDVVRAARILHLNGRHWEASLHAAAVARKGGVTVSFDGGAHRFRPEHRELLPRAEVCIVAAEYAAAYTGAADTAAGAEALLAAGPSLVVITEGTAGSRVHARGGESFHQPAFRVKPVIDTTGAGDAYHGAFLFALARGCSLKETARYAAAVGAMNTRALGGRAALPTLSELETFLSGAP
ncbi:PfkB family carbohydrate kinase [Geomonas paludis]|uniref:PfkB family carbohydrate kinase n=1 Tax=Geomonas paludis TaxID=2740185 RepID=A0A6V8MX30_9BACT|nr:PfkB family carbohydrate kinase [Geomonas paludis]UPU34255.1 PfkB family carbohydrate kinase [Geomonas paludis]GFO64237.1 ribokinase [Geomonas paludis]